MIVSSVCFDFGGVATARSSPALAYSLAAGDGIAEHVLDVGYQRYRNLMDGGFISPEQMYALIFSDLAFDIPSARLAAYVEADRSSFLLKSASYDAVLALMDRLHTQGYKIGILSNMAPAFCSTYRDAYSEFFSAADVIVLSGDVHAFKPQAQIYRIAEERLGTRGHRVCLIDDSQPNCEAARSAGWGYVRFQTAVQAEADLYHVLDGTSCNRETMS